MTRLTKQSNDFKRKVDGIFNLMKNLVAMASHSEPIVEQTSGDIVGEMITLDKHVLSIPGEFSRELSSMTRLTDEDVNDQVTNNVVLTPPTHSTEIIKTRFLMEY